MYRQGKLLCFRVYYRNQGELGQNFRSIIKIFMKKGLKIFKIFSKNMVGSENFGLLGGSYPPIPPTCPRMLKTVHHFRMTQLKNLVHSTRYQKKTARGLEGLTHHQLRIVKETDARLVQGHAAKFVQNQIASRSKNRASSINLLDEWYIRINKLHCKFFTSNNYCFYQCQFVAQLTGSNIHCFCQHTGIASKLRDTSKARKHYWRFWITEKFVLLFVSVLFMSYAKHTPARWGADASQRYESRKIYST